MQAELDAKIEELEQFQGQMMAQLMSNPSPQGAADGAARLEQLMAELTEIKCRCRCPSPTAAASELLLPPNRRSCLPTRSSHVSLFSLSPSPLTAVATSLDGQTEAATPAEAEDAQGELAKETVVLEGDAVVLEAGTAVLEGDAVPVEGDAVVLEGDAVVLEGDAVVLEGDALVL